MPFAFDATLKEILRDHAAAYAAVFGLPLRPAVDLNVDLSTLSAATDVALGFGDPVDEIVDLNFQSGPDRDVGKRCLLYSAALHYRYGVSVTSKLILLRPVADHPALTGHIAYRNGPNGVEFDYDVIRMWTQPLAAFLTGGLGLLPLAPLCQLPANVPLETAIAEVVREIDRRLRAEATPEVAAALMTGAYILTGARLDRDTTRGIFRGVIMMEESSTYQLILEEGAVRKMRSLILKMGRNRFGPPDAAIEGVIRAVEDLDRLDRMHDAIPTLSSWQELLNTL